MNLFGAPRKILGIVVIKLALPVRPTGLPGSFKRHLQNLIKEQIVFEGFPHVCFGNPLGLPGPSGTLLPKGKRRTISWTA